MQIVAICHGDVKVTTTSTEGGEGEGNGTYTNLLFDVGETKPLNFMQFNCKIIEGDLEIYKTTLEDLRYFNFIFKIYGKLIIRANQS